MGAVLDSRPLDPDGKRRGPHAGFLEWQPVYSVHIGIIDEHHKKLFELVNRLHEAMCLRKERMVLTATLNELINRTQTHFASEEVLMESFGFSGRRQHKAEHDRLIEIIREFQELFVSGQADLTLGLMEFLNIWLANHISGMDQGYRKFFTDLGAR